MQGSWRRCRPAICALRPACRHRDNKYEYFPDPINTPESVLDHRELFSRSARPSARRKSTRSTASCWCRSWPTSRGSQSLNLELGYRTTDNDPSKDDDTYKALIDWSIVDRVRFRGGRQIANRAPNIGELFQASEQFAPFTVRARRSVLDARSGAAAVHGECRPSTEHARANQVIALCSALMGPQGAATFYGDPSMSAKHAAEREDLESAGQSESALGAGGDDDGGRRGRPYRQIHADGRLLADHRSPT